MKTEYELRVLEIDVEQIVKLLKDLGAKKTEEMKYKRYVFYTNKKKDNEWIRLRTDGKNSTITYKKIDNEVNIEGTKELEIEVDDFEKSKHLLEIMGFEIKGYQENNRIRYILDGVEIDIDTWPLIPTYLEIEGENEEKVLGILNLLKVDKNKVTYLNCGTIYKEIYGINIDNIKSMSFESVEYKGEK